MKRSGILLISLTLNLALVAALVVSLKRRQASPVPEVVTVTRAASNRTVADLHWDATNPPAAVSRPTRFHWGRVESADYHQYIANLRAIGCPERLIRDIIIADVGKLYAGKIREVYSVREDWQPWYSSDRRQVRNRERFARLSALQVEQRALLKELLGIESTERWDDLMHSEGTFALVLGFLLEPKPAQIFAMIEEFSDASRQVDERAKGILLEEDREQLARLRQGVMARFAALMTPVEFEELSLRAQYLGKFMEGEMYLEGVTLSGPEFRQLCGLSRLTGDVIQEELLRDGKELSDEEEERRQKAFEVEVKKLLGPARFADFERAQQSEFREALEFTELHQLPIGAAARISEAVRYASAQADKINEDESLTPDERLAALTLLKSVTVNSLSSALGSKYAEYAKTKGTALDDLIELPSAVAEGHP
jgi:hypothetical protein